MTDVNAVPNPGADDAAKYAALAKELGMEEPAASTEGEQQDDQQQQQQAGPQQEQQPETVARAEHENVQKALREAREAARASDERLRGIIQLIEQTRSQRPQEPKRDEPKVPDVNEDPIGFFKAEVARLEAQLAEAHNGVRLTAEEQRAYQQQQQLWATVQRSEADILDPESQGHKADYWDACKHLEDQRVAELEEMYPEGNPYVAQYARQQGFADAAQLKLAILNHDRQAVAIQALQLGKSPAQVYYDLAVRRGYQPKAAQQKNGADKGKQIIEAAKKGRAASVSISGDGGGRKGAEDMTLTDLADMFLEDPDTADKIWNQMAKAGKLG